MHWPDFVFNPEADSYWRELLRSWPNGSQWSGLWLGMNEGEFTLSMSMSLAFAVHMGCGWAWPKGELGLWRMVENRRHFGVQQPLLLSAYGPAASGAGLWMGTNEGKGASGRSQRSHTFSRSGRCSR